MTLHTDDNIQIHTKAYDKIAEKRKMLQVHTIQFLFFYKQKYFSVKQIVSTIFVALLVAVVLCKKQNGLL